MMIVKCKTNSGFEDQLTSNSSYRVKELGENSYLVQNDKGQVRWYGQQNFNIEKVCL